jgi:phage gp29-like protein
MYLFKNGGFRDWSVFLERFGMPFLLGKIPSGDYRDAKLRNELMQQLMAVRSGGSGVGTTETDMQMLNGATSGSQTAYLDFCHYCDDIITLAILGQLGTSAKSTGFSNGGAQAQVRQDILDADCALVSGVINKALIPWMCAVRGLPQDADVEFVIDSEEPEDLERRASRDLKLAQATGCKLAKEYAEKTYGVELDDAAAEPSAIDGQQQRQPAPFSDHSAPIAEADRIVKSAIERMVGERAFEAWRGPVEDAISAAFGDLDPEAEDLVERFTERVPKFLDSLPSALAGMDAAAFRKTLEDAMLASFVDGLMPESYWRETARG